MKRETLIKLAFASLIISNVLLVLGFVIFVWVVFFR